VNGRSVRDRVLTKAVSEAYRPLLSQGAYPVAILFVEIPWADVDVNVHPAKTEVRFRRSAAVAEAVRDAVQSALARAGYFKVDSAGRVESAEDDAAAAIEPFNEVVADEALAENSIRADRAVSVTDSAGVVAQQIAEAQPSASAKVEMTRVDEVRDSVKKPSAQIVLADQGHVQTVQTNMPPLVDRPDPPTKVLKKLDSPVIDDRKIAAFPP